MTRKDVLAKAIISGEVSLSDINQVREYLQSRNIFFELRSIGQGSRRQVQIFQRGKGWLSLTDWKDNYLQGLQAESMSLQKRCESLGLTTMSQALSLDEKKSVLPEVFILCNASNHNPGSTDLSSLFYNMRVGVTDADNRMYTRKPRFVAAKSKTNTRQWIVDTDDSDEVAQRIKQMVSRRNKDEI